MNIKINSLFIVKFLCFETKVALFTIKYKYNKGFNLNLIRDRYSCKKLRLSINNILTYHTYERLCFFFASGIRLD